MKATATLRAMKTSELRAAIEASREPLDLLAMADEARRRRGAEAQRLAHFAWGRARAVKAAATRAAKRPLSLVAWLVKAGGVKDPHGEIHRDIRRAFPGLVLARGMALDIAAVAARDAGYFPERPRPVTTGGGGRAYGGDDGGVDQMGVPALLSAIEDEAAGRRQRLPHWAEQVADPDPDKVEHEDQQAARELAERWLEMVRIAEEHGPSETWRFIVRTAGIVIEEIPF